MVSRQFLLLLLLPLLGCDPPDPPPPPDLPVRPAASGTQFDAHQSGRLHGRIRWIGPLPVSTALESVDQPLELASLPIRARSNPHRLRVSKEGGLAGALVWLEGIDPARAPPWQPEPA
ncbi:MAG: hypothetical protein SNJ82_08395, partial [Gemmataceae bacterium]